MSSASSMDSMRNLVVGVEEPVQLLDGTSRPYINFDNASSTPFLHSVLDRITRFAPMYANVGRGSGYKSHASSEAFDAARATIGEFVGASRETHVVILGKNTTEALNKLAHCLQLHNDDVILTSGMEHHSNELPWRRTGEVHRIGIQEDGSLDMSHLRALLARFGNRVRVVSVTGASNVTGHINPLGEIAELVHATGARFAVDAAQLAPHRPIDVGKPDDPRRIDFLTYTGHKMYAPLGIGALVALRDAIEAPEPDLVGGGTVDFVTEEDVVWSQLPAREEAGTPNIVGAIGWAQAIDTLADLGMNQVAEHESALTAKLLSLLAKRPSIQVFGDPDPDRSSSRLGVVTISVRGASHRLAAAVLGYEGGIGVRAGLFCAHPYVQRLLDMPRDKSTQIVERFRAGIRPNVPGLLRASFGIYNTISEVEEFVRMLDTLCNGTYRGEYLVDPDTGQLLPEGEGGWETKAGAWSPRSCT